MSLMPLPEKLMPLATEIETLYRELPRLLREGHAGRVAVVKGDRIEVYDTDDEAFEVGEERYGGGPYLAQPINPADVSRLAPYFLPLAEAARA